MTQPIKAVGEAVNAVLQSGAWKGTKYLSDKLIVRATRKAYHGRFINRGNTEIMLTIGRPNWYERLFIRACKQAGERFPVRKVQLKFLPKKAKS